MVGIMIRQHVQPGSGSATSVIGKAILPGFVSDTQVVKEDKSSHLGIQPKSQYVVNGLSRRTAKVNVLLVSDTGAFSTLMSQQKFMDYFPQFTEKPRNQSH